MNPDNVIRLFPPVPLGSAVRITATCDCLICGPVVPDHLGVEGVLVGFNPDPESAVPYAVRVASGDIFNVIDVEVAS